MHATHCTLKKACRAVGIYPWSFKVKLDCLQATNTTPTSKTSAQPSAPNTVVAWFDEHWVNGPHHDIFSLLNIFISQQWITLSARRSKRGVTVILQFKVENDPWWDGYTALRPINMSIVVVTLCDFVWQNKMSFIHLFILVTACCTNYV